MLGIIEISSRKKAGRVILIAVATYALLRDCTNGFMQIEILNLDVQINSGEALMGLSIVTVISAILWLAFYIREIPHSWVPPREGLAGYGESIQWGHSSVPKDASVAGSSLEDVRTQGEGVQYKFRRAVAKISLRLVSFITILDLILPSAAIFVVFFWSVGPRVCPSFDASKLGAVGGELSALQN